MIRSGSVDWKHRPQNRLRCPVTKTPLEPLHRDQLKCLNRLVAAGRARHVDGTTVSPALRGAVITTDGRLIYRFDNHHAIIQATKAISADQLPEVVCRKDRAGPSVSVKPVS